MPLRSQVTGESEDAIERDLLEIREERERAGAGGHREREEEERKFLAVTGGVERRRRGVARREARANIRAGVMLHPNQPRTP
jgi:hypothetical protein